MWNFFGKTDIGLMREQNEDSFFAQYINDDTLLCVVCDGMGGVNGGCVASSLAIESFVSYVKESILNTSQPFIKILPSALERANKALYNKANQNPALSGMGTTMCALVIKGDEAFCLSVGDSRVYVLKDNDMYQLTHDHSYVQTLVDAGRITPDEMKTHPNRNIIIKAVGIEEEISPDMFLLDASLIDGFVICSDGLSGYVEDDAVKSIVTSLKSPEESATKLVDMANNEGGHDNITVVVVKKQN